MRLENRVALVTGGGTGIGRAIVLRLVADGARVVLTGRRREPLDALAAQHPDRLHAVAADVTRAGDPQRAVLEAVNRFGRLDLLVNSAGGFLKRSLAETTDDDLAQMLDVNVRGLIATCREAVPYLAQTRGGIINISSAAGTYVKANLVAYGAAKAAVHHATKILAVELGPQGIRVNAVAPGFTRTEMTDYIFQDPKLLETLIGQTALRRVGEPEDVARVVALLASDDAAWITGQIIAASGGLML